MRRSSFLIALLVAAGCGGETKKPDDSAPPPQRSTAPAQQPKKEQPKAPEAQKPAAAPAEADEPIVIKGSKRKDSGSASSADAARQAKIDELKARAKASEGKDNGPVYRESQDAPADAPGNDKLKAQLAQIDAQIKSLRDEKAAMTHKQSHREGRYLKEETTYDDPDRAKAIDDQIATLEQQKRDLQAKAAADAAKGDAAKGDAPKGDAPKGDAPKSDAPK